VVENKGVAGLQVAVRLPDGKMWTGAAGNAEFTPDRALEDDSAMAIASVTKTFVAALILQLAEEGKLSLDDRLTDYVPDAPRARGITLRQLLSHTSGIYNYFANPRYGKAAGAWLKQAPQPGLLSRQHRWTFDEIMGLVRAPDCKPGTCYNYSNTGYVLLGRVAEVAGDAPLHKQLRRRFFRPLGLKDTLYQPAEKPPLDAAHGHWDVGTGYSDHTRDARIIPFMAAASVADAAGAIASTAADLATWAGVLYGGQVLSRASLEEMTTILPEGTYGLGTDVAAFAGHRAYGHRGGLRGFESSMWYFPRSGVSIALISNQGNWNTDAPMQRIVKAVLD
jgi:D-alanyl-D-alanine carboxypeptidase